MHHKLVRRRWLVGMLLLLSLSLLSLPISGQAQTAPQPPSAAQFDLTTSTPGGMSIALLLPAVQKLTSNPDPAGAPFTELILPGASDALPTGEGAAVGRPAIPVITRIIAVPQETMTPTVRISNLVIAETLENVMLYPIQPTPVDQAQEFAEEGPIDYGDAPFTINMEAYQATTAQPAQPVELVPLGTMRDLKLFQLRVAAVQYTPATRQATIYRSMNIQLEFPNGRTFLSEQAQNPFEDHRLPLLDLVLNREAVRAAPFKPSERPLAACVGYEYLIITAPAFREAADTLAAWKTEKGIATQVIQTGNGPNDAGTTREAIRAKIAEIYNRCNVRPSYLLLLGDAEHIPPWYVIRRFDEGVPVYIGTDYPYSTMPKAVVDDAQLIQLPDLAMGRIPVDTLAQANTVVNKIITYERNPPTQASFYQNATFASYFQCCWANKPDGTTTRGYIQTSEQIRDYMVSQNYSVQRIYKTDAASYDDPNAGNFYDPNTRDTTPRFYRNGTALPNAIGPSSGFNWNGSTQDVIDAFNAGRFLILHRDHGASNGWIDPNFRTSNINALTNTSLQPVVYSINCTSGYFDNETNAGGNASAVYFAEELLRRANGGSVGIIAATRASPTWENNALSRGLFDATWPNFAPTFGANTSITRLGDILNHGKIYMLSQAFVNQPSLVDGGGNLGLESIRNNFNMYHLFGDPTMEMWTANPNTPPALAAKTRVVSQTPNQMVLAYPQEGAIITVMQNGTPLGRGRVADGQATLDFIVERDASQPLQIAANLPGVISAPLSSEHAIFLPLVQR
ncbi:MAG: hypothetical protein EI684_13815 [Candidatus Viridilinea halotolerans]|uniref:Gingipain domain-containing protein n=1 Tax=Candidatus Viridilinea halotolerans TaxID=2491704 RepID=A0A426TWZ4_9CHLR|nr:MAG: hypothetical protein EI684_13815 [Candidatus Viridilinea halotolerans]